MELIFIYGSVSVALLLIYIFIVRKAEKQA